ADRLKNERLVMEERIRELEPAATSSRLMPKNEFALVDGQVIGVDPTTSRLTIDRGRQHKIVLGATFSVYDDASNIRPDEQGNYPAGKATVEVVRIHDATSECRITRATRGNPVVRGDVIANALYDPNKTYKFTVF